MNRIIIFFAVLLASSTTPLSAQFQAVRIDALALMTGTLHAGVDFTLDKKLSLDASLYWNPMKFDAFRSKLLIRCAFLAFRTPRRTVLRRLRRSRTLRYGKPSPASQRHSGRSRRILRI